MATTSFMVCYPFSVAFSQAVYFFQVLLNPYHVLKISFGTCHLAPVAEVYSLSVLLLLIVFLVSKNQSTHVDDCLLLCVTSDDRLALLS